MFFENSVYPKIETGYALKLYMSVITVDDFNIETFNQDGNESAILELKYYIPTNLLLQHLLIEGKIKNTEVSSMRNGYINDTLTSVDIQGILKIGRKMIRIYEGVIYRENFKISSLWKIIEEKFNSRQSYEDEKNNSVQGLAKLFINSSYRVQIQKYVNDSFYCESGTWMKTDYDENVLDYWKLHDEHYNTEMKKDDGLDDDCDNKKLYLHIQEFLSSALGKLFW